MKTTLEELFLIFHEENPHVYKLLVELARDWKICTGKRIGIKALFERARWESAIQTNGNEYVLNNNYSAYYARLIMRQERDLDGLFNVREQRVKVGI